MTATSAASRHRRHLARTTRAEARYDVFEYIEVFYNRQRRHSYLGYVSPARFEAEAMAKAISNSRGDAA